MRSSDFINALRSLRSGNRLTRTAWGGDATWIVIEPVPLEDGEELPVGGPAPISGIPEGMKPCIKIYMSDGLSAVWDPGQSDLFAVDWHEVEDE